MRRKYSLAYIAPSPPFRVVLILFYFELHVDLVRHYGEEIECRILLDRFFRKAGTTLMVIKAVLRLGVGEYLPQLEYVAYTNLLFSWCFFTAMRLIHAFDFLVGWLGIINQLYLALGILNSLTCGILFLPCS